MTTPNFRPSEHLGTRIVHVGHVSLRIHRRTALVSAIAVLMIFAAILAALLTGTIPISLADLATVIGGEADARTARVVLDLRLPRAVTGVAVGAALGIAGGVFQSLSRNAIGSPDIIGFVSGAAAGAVVQITLFAGGVFAVAMSAIAGGLATAAAVYALSFRGRATGGYRLVLVGIGVGAMLSALNSLLLTRSSEDTAMMAQLWLTGSLNARTWQQALPVFIAVVVFLPLLLLSAARINALELGEDAATQLGVPAEQTRRTMMVLGVGLTAMAVAAAGPISFVALAAPHIARRLTRSPAVPLLTAGLWGSVLLVAADLASQHLPLRLAMPVGLLTGLIGGIYLLVLLARSTRL
ncbi:MAG: iron chelate uptake ABC transporter family permease subunit [Microbacterium sp.]|nr:iron chelate uptake ABC transporter family permease subunit [Microbacterium sp.]